jgi:hypothetical protein
MTSIIFSICVMGEKIMKVKSCFGTMIRIDFDNFPNFLECSIRAIFSAVQNFQSLPLNLDSNFGDLI